MSDSYTTVVNGHRSAHVPADPNNTLEISGRGGSPGKAHPEYRVFRFGEEATPVAVLRFHTAAAAGLTNEALLAVVYDRLREFQAGEQPCGENEHAMTHVAGALYALKNRTARLHATPPEEKTVAEDPKPAAEPPHRVRVEDGRLHVGEAVFSTDELKLWKQWSLVEAACKRLDPPLSPLELEVICKAAEHLGAGARNGLTELKSALASTRAAKIG